MRMGRGEDASGILRRLIELYGQMKETEKTCDVEVRLASLLKGNQSTCPAVL
jgi:negative regulator of replication initiation